MDSINKNKIYSSDINFKIKSNDWKLNPNANIFISKKIDNNIAKLPSGGRWYSSAHNGGTNSTEAMICDLRHNSNPVYDKKQVTNNNDRENADSSITTYDEITILRVKNPKKVILGHLNINSIPNKFTGIMDLVKGKLDIFLISETKIDNSFPDAQFYCEGYSSPHRRDRSNGAGGLLLYINENIPSGRLKCHYAPDDIEIICVEINLRKQKWVIIGICRPPTRW